MVTTRRSVATEPAEGSTVRYDRSTERRWAFDGSDVVALLVGLFYGVVGLLALINVGFDDFPSEETTEVAGLVQTQLWGIVGIVLALLLLGSVGAYGRSLATFSGALMLVIGIVVVSAHDRLDAVLTTESAYGWVAIVLGVVVLIAAVAVPTVTARRDQLVEETTSG